jgi:5-methylcytosine-specific restriction endonuclease McrA
MTELSESTKRAIKERNDYYDAVRKNMKSKNNARRSKILEEQAIFMDLMEKCDGRCARCDRQLKPTLDHIVPSTILEDMGFDTKREVMAGNYQILCGLCNTFKGARLDFANPNTKRILLELLEKI